MSTPPTSTTSSSASSSIGEKKAPRQRPGLACEACRKRKLRCDGQQPQCGACFEAEVDCVTPNTTTQRGPRKGHMKALQNRLSKLEQQLKIQQQGDGDLPIEETCPNLELDSVMSEPLFTIPLPTPPGSSMGSTLDSYMFDLPADFFISELYQADLDQLYFERAHPFVPILHQRHYFSWSRQTTKTDSQICLQYAMWTLAASLSPQMMGIGASIYKATLSKLEILQSNISSKADFDDIEHIQARLLILIYDFTQTNHPRGWMSSGCCFRLLQLMRLYELDAPDSVAKRNSNGNAPSGHDGWLRTEEKRRTFWMAYTLDRFISLRHEWPLMLHEHVISVRLPVPEENFRTGIEIEMGFLSEAMVDGDTTRLSPFTEVIILATICGRAITHQQQSAVSNMYRDMAQNFWDFHQWLDGMLKERVRILNIAYPPPTQNPECMLLFANMIAHTTILYLCKIIGSVEWDQDQHKSAVVAFKQRSLLAAKEIVNLSRCLSVVSHFKVHPFTPLSLILCADFLNSNLYLDESVASQIQEIYDALRGMGSVNNLAQDYILS